MDGFLWWITARGGEGKGRKGREGKGGEGKGISAHSHAN